MRTPLSTTVFALTVFVSGFVVAEDKRDLEKGWPIRTDDLVLAPADTILSFEQRAAGKPIRPAKDKLFLAVAVELSAKAAVPATKKPATDVEDGKLIEEGRDPISATAYGTLPRRGKSTVVFWAFEIPESGLEKFAAFRFQFRSQAPAPLPVPSPVHFEDGKIPASAWPGATTKMTLTTSAKSQVVSTFQITPFGGKSDYLTITSPDGKPLAMAQEGDAKIAEIRPSLQIRLNPVGTPEPKPSKKKGLFKEPKIVWMDQPYELRTTKGVVIYRHTPK